MGSFGEHLRREREMRGISLDQIVATTKIGRRLLTALEDEQFDLLPGGIFNKAYVRAYAKCVGMDEEQAVAEYLQAAHEALPDSRVIAQQHASIYAPGPVRRPGFPVTPVLILVAVIAAGVGGWKLYRDHLKEREKQAEVAAPPADMSPQSQATSAPASVGGEPPSAQTSVLPKSTASPGVSPHSQPMSSPAAKTPAPATATAAAARQPESSSAGAPSEGSFEVVVRPKSTAWVSIKSDGQIVVRGVIKPPDVKTIRANNQVVFFTGNAGAVELSFNGKNVPVSGGVNEEQTLVFDSRGVLPPAPPKTGTE